MSTTAGRHKPRHPLFVDCKEESSFGYPKGSVRIKAPPLSDDEEVDASCTQADDHSVSMDYQNYSDNDNFVYVKSCLLPDENSNNSLPHEPNEMTIDTNDESAMCPIKKELDIDGISTMSNVPDEDDFIDNMSLIHRMFMPMNTTRSSKRLGLRRIKMMMEKLRPPPVELPKAPPKPRPKPRPKVQKSIPAPCAPKMRMILPKLMPILLVTEGRGPEAEEPAPEAEDPLREEHLVGENLNAMDKMLDNLRNTCPVCSMRFDTALQMGKHFRQRHEDQYRCRNCSFRCSTIEDLSQHMRIHDQDAFLQCNLCDRKYKRSRGLLAHWIQKHTTEDPQSMLDMLPQQDVPALRNAEQDDSWDHRELILRRTYSCKKCKNAYPRKSLLIAHERIAHGIGAEPKKYHCDTCNKTFQNRHQIYNHKKTHHTVQVTSCNRYLLPKQTQSWDGQYQRGYF